jgi:phenylpyruvate tautomerase PptA (4-oxalocrotonate tautomerase family)
VPIVRIDIEAGKSTEYKRAILHGVRTALTGALGVPDERIMQRIIETPIDDIDAPEVRSDRLTIIEIAMLPGRDAALKNELYGAVVRELGVEPGIHSHDIVVIIGEPDAECLFLNGKQCATPAVSSVAEQDASATQSQE